MPKPRNLEAIHTSIKIFWHQKDRMSAYRERKKVDAAHKPRSQRDDEVFEEILSYYEKTHPLKESTPKSTFS